MSSSSQTTTELRIRLQDCAVRLARDTDAALCELYDLTAQRLVRYAYTITRHLEDAEDAFQAALVRIARKPRRLVKADHPWAYFARVVRNEALRIVGRRRGPSASLQMVYVTDRGAEDVDIAERNRLVRAAVDSLPPAQAEVVVLKIWEEMTFAEIADVLEESPNTVASRYRYALTRLSTSLPALLPREVLHD